MNSYSNYMYVHEAILYETIDKYEAPNIKHPFYIKALVPLESEVGRTISVQRNNIINKDLTMLATETMTSEITLDLIIPKYLVMDYSDKYIPKGTKFIVCFIGGNINNCQLIGRCNE